ncbi:MAG: hypothetical protein IPH18_01615 [Chitinophagaceae bacterium]|nr:hypothetical protein [Chitinophagaceae bacterium]MBK8952884.1 hypothetical protein [Chitinophagaceae bacterium]
MKGGYITSIFLLSYFTSNNALSQKTSYGIKAGVNLSTVTGEAFPDDIVKMLAGYHAVFFITIRFPFI